MKLLDDLLDRVTMYRLVLYCLIFLVVWAQIFGFNIFIQTTFLVIFCSLTNKIFAKIFKISPNTESFAITALILSLILGPTQNYFLLISASLIAMAGKYIIVLHRRHIFNPAGFAVLVCALVLNQGASWWVGSQELILPTIVCGLLILKKTRRFILATTFLVIYFIFNLNSWQNILYSPILFFAFIMLTEPLTSPWKKNYQIIYGAAVALLFSLLPIILPNINYHLELSLILGNIFSFFISPNFRFNLCYESKENVGKSINNFHFFPDKKLNYRPGQCIELTLQHSHSDDRGIRRFFTIASSPSEKQIIIGSKFAETKGSSFKNALLNIPTGTNILATNPMGDFCLPKDKTAKLVFMAGGIGITPFRSMIKFLIDNHESRSIVLFYCVNDAEEFVYKNIISYAKVVYKIGRLDTETIFNEVPDFKERLFYLSGPHTMVTGFEKTLGQMGVKRNQIKTDYFPGYA